MTNSFGKMQVLSDSLECKRHLSQDYAKNFQGSGKIGWDFILLYPNGGFQAKSTGHTLNLQLELVHWEPNLIGSL